jgi:hypothetical protein
MRRNHRKHCANVVWCLAIAAVVFVASRATADDSASEWMQLFNGQDLTGWKANEKPDQWKVEEGAIVAHGDRSHLFYVGADPAAPPEFKNFHFRAELMTLPNSNSGIYFHTKWQNDGWPQTGYECQVNNSHADPVRTASLYNVRKNFVPPAKDNEWFTEEIIVEGRHIVTKVNGLTIIDYNEPEVLDRVFPKLESGTFALQAHDPGSTAKFRKIEVKRLP